MTASRTHPLAPVVAVGSALVLTAGALLLGGHDPASGLAALVGGALGSWDRFLSITLVRAVPLILAGLAVALAFRASVWNIGAEGQFYAGATMAVWLGLLLPPLPGILGLAILLIASGMAGALWAWVPAIMRVRLGTSEVISTLLMNFVAIYLAAFLVHGPLREPRGVFPQSEAIPNAFRLPILVPGSRLHAGLALALLVALAMWFLLARTAFGFRIRAVGASEEAARVSGAIDTGAVMFRTLMLSGLIAGLAGGVELTGVTFALYEDLSPGYGYTAIAVALLGGLRPAGVVLAGLFFGALEGGASAMQRQAGIPSVWVNVIEALVILTVLVVERVMPSAPGAGVGGGAPDGRDKRGGAAGAEHHASTPGGA